MSNIPMDQWGRDHWSTFAYVETRIVEHKGVLDIRHMRCDPSLHPLLAHAGSHSSKLHPTRLRVGTQAQHDDWSCLDDAEAAGLLRNIGTGMNRVYALTDAGHHAAAALRRHQAQGGGFAGFSYSAPNHELQEESSPSGVS